MSTAVEITCPNCGKNLKVPPSAFGKRVRCKHCAHVFPVQDPGGARPAGAEAAGRATRPAANAPTANRSTATTPSPPPPPTPPRRPYLDDDDNDQQKIELVKDDEAPRCPHCALELIPPDAKVCIHCGFNNVTRTKAQTVRVWEPTLEEWIKHLLPGVLALLLCIGLIVWQFVVYFNMREWMVDSFLELDDKDATGKKKYIVPPGFFITLNFVVSIPMFVPCAKFAYRRLVREYRPPERVRG